jgi:hypothetical protein
MPSVCLGVADAGARVLNSPIRALPLTSDLVEGWNRTAATSDDAWFWHTTGWLDFVQEVGRDRRPRNMSFVIAEGAEILAICPVTMEQVNGHWHMTYLQEFIPFPAFQPGLVEARRTAAMACYVKTLASLAKEHDVAYVRIGTPALAPAQLRAQLPTVSPLLRFGYFEVPIATQVVDLTQSVAALRAGLRKGHRADITRASRLCTVRVWDHTNITVQKFREYQDLHAKAAGGMKRSQRSFDLMLGWIRERHAMLVEASYGERPTAFALILLFGAGAYYGSACKDPDHRDLPSSHLVQWHTILWLKERQFHHYDLGLQYFDAQWCHVPSSKDLSLSSFKRGFGGRTLRVPMAEFFYSTSLFEEQAGMRLRQYVASREPRLSEEGRP